MQRLKPTLLNIHDFISSSNYHKRCYFHFIDQKTVVQKGEVTCSESYSHTAPQEVKIQIHISQIPEAGAYALTNC